MTTRKNLARGDSAKHILLRALLTLLALVLVACSSGGVRNPDTLSVTPMSGPPGTVLTITGLALSPSDSLEVWVWGELAPARLSEDGTLAAAMPLFLAEDGWPHPPAEPQLVEVRRAATVLGRSAEGVTVTELPRAPGSTQEVLEALTSMTEAFDGLWSLVPAELIEEAPLREAALAMLRGLVSEGEDSLEAILAGTAPVLAGVEPDLTLIDALLASSGALEYYREYAQALHEATAQAELSAQALMGLCKDGGEDTELACKMQIRAVLQDFTEAFVTPSVKTYANTVGLAAGLTAIVVSGGTALPAAALIGAILGVADFVMSKVV
ncbi:MAG: hypothetical protein M3511_13490, partial [Deinococcota bacterium]|nr:hypothetical protein [Deinococcota bacterium]